MLGLSADHRRVLVLVCVDGRNYEEVSALLQVPVGTVRSRLSRARRQMRDILNVPLPRLAG